MSSDVFTVRPYVRGSGTAVSSSGHFFVPAGLVAYLSAADLANLELEPGDCCWLRPTTAGPDGAVRTVVAVAKHCDDQDMRGKSRMVKVPDCISRLFGLTSRTKVVISGVKRTGMTVSPSGTNAGSCAVVKAGRVELVAEDDAGRRLKKLPTGHVWANRALATMLGSISLVCRGTCFRLTVSQGVDRGKSIVCVVRKVEGVDEVVPNGLVGMTVQGDQVFEVDSGMGVEFVSHDGGPIEGAGERRSGVVSTTTTTTATTETKREIRFGDLAGVDVEIDRICTYLDINQSVPIPPSCRAGKTVLVTGPAGTGKAMMSAAIGNVDGHWKAQFELDDQSGSAKSVKQVKTVFSDAASIAGPVLVRLGRIDSLGGGRAGSTAEAAVFVHALVEGIKSVEEKDVTVVGSAGSALDVPELIRNLIEREVELPIPNMQARRQISTLMFRQIGGRDNDEKVERLAEMVSQVTHGYVGRDLRAVIKMAFGIAFRRCSRSRDETIDRFRVDQVEKEDVNGAIKLVQPSALRHLVVESPNVLWADIGGCEQVKEKLEMATSMRVARPGLFDHFTVPAPKGILMYGPPGCSKTLTAKAAATQSGFNFIAVKGAELTNMYVGETERAIREVFRKARAAQPAIIFFDEIDAIAGRRQSGISSSSGSHPGLAVVTTLLNEMDGIEALGEVLVLAATNRPESLDDALVRPGRFSDLIYLGLPDLQSRKAILSIRTRNVPINPEVNLDSLADQTQGYTSAEVVEVVNQACTAALIEHIRTSRQDGIDLSQLVISDNQSFGQVGQVHFEFGLESVVPAVKPEMISHFEKWRTNRRTR